MDNRTFAADLYEFLKDNESLGHFEGISAEDGISELEEYLSDLDMVKETIKDIEGIADAFDDHEVYINEVKPLLKGLRAVQEKLEAERSRRMVADTGYEVKQSIRIGNREILMAENPKAEDGNFYMKAEYTENGLIGEYSQVVVDSDYLEILREFARGLHDQIEKVASEICKAAYQPEPITAKECHPNDYSQSIVGKVVAIKAEALRPEYRRGDMQLVLVDGGNGANANARGNAVFCTHLNDGSRTRFERYDMQGEIAKESDTIQSALYNNSMKISKRNTGVLYYDCTNYFFEIEQDEGLKQYGPSKEHKPNPIVQMGLFMDGDGIPLAFSINKGNINEQLTLKPLEEKILSDFNLSRFVVCTDAGLASESNRKFNNKGKRAFITTQSIKKLKTHLRDWALDPKGWSLDENGRTYDITELDEEKFREKVFHKERWIKENELEQKIIVTYSIKYRDYQRVIRNSQIERAQKAITHNPERLKKSNPNDYKRFIEKNHCTKDGEAAKQEWYSINTDLIAKEEAYDGFYAVCTNLEDDAPVIIQVNKRRWEIEECFRIMKSEFKARPVYLSRDDRIEAHFMTCFLSLVIFRLLEKKLNGKYTCQEIITALRDMSLLEEKGEGYTPVYTRTDLTDDLHDAFGFRTDYQIVDTKQMKKILKITKS